MTALAQAQAEVQAALLRHAFRQARLVERLGGRSQGERLARLQSWLNVGALEDAMIERDAIRKDFMRVLFAWCMGPIICGMFLAGFMLHWGWGVAAFLVMGIVGDAMSNT